MFEWNRIVSHPALQFFVAGILVFMLYGRYGGDDLKTIVISPERVSVIENQFRTSFGRSPTDAERDKLVAKYVRDEVLFREAIALDLYLTDEIVRRRLIGTMEFLNEGSAAFDDPSEEDLRAFWAGSKTDYSRPARITLTHVFVNFDAGAAAAEQEALAAREALIGGAQARLLGDLFLQGRVLRGKTELALSDIFGKSLAGEIMTMPVGDWSEPKASIFGLHVIKVTQHVDARDLAFEEVRDDLSKAWRRARLQEARTENLEKLVSEYEVKGYTPNGGTK